MSYQTFFLDQGETLGGAERFLIDFFERLTPKETHKIKPVVVGAKHPKYCEKIRGKVPVINFRYPSVRSKGIGKIFKSLGLMHSARKLVTLVRSRQVSRRKPVVWANTPRTIFLAYLAKRFWSLDCRLIVMIHDFTIPSFLLKKIAHAADTIVVNSMLTRQRVRGMVHPSNHGKICIIENGIDFKSIPKATPPKKIENIVLVGRIDPRKGQEYAIEAADLLLERNPDLNFFVVGSSFAQDPRTVTYHTKIKQFATDRKLNNLFFVDEVDDPFEVFAKSDLVLVLPTEPETFGRVTIEALSQGKMVIAFDQDGPKQILESFAKFAKANPDLVLCEVGNAMTLAEKIGYLADNPDETEIYTQNARPFTEKYFDFTETKKRMINLLLDK